jgi:hypothetical protein
MTIIVVSSGSDAIQHTFSCPFDVFLLQIHLFVNKRKGRNGGRREGGRNERREIGKGRRGNKGKLILVFKKRAL